MEQILTISEARRKLPSLLKTLQKDPSVSFTIKVHQEPIATLRVVKQQISKEGRAVKALLRLVARQEKKKRAPHAFTDASVHSKNFKNFLYGK